MTATPWSVKGIDPKAREVAKDLARRSGMTLGEWLNRMILEDDGPEDVASESYFTESPSFDRRKADRGLAERGTPEPSIRTYYETARPTPALRPDPLASAPSRFEAPEHPADEISRVALALDRLAERIETSETRTGLAISGVEHSVREAVARIEASEREHVAVAARFEGAVDEARSEQDRIAERLRRIEQDAAGPRSAEALRSLELALGKVASHLYEGETRTNETMAALNRRLEAAERSGGGQVSADLVDDVVSRVAARLGAAEARTAGALEGLKASFASLDDRLRSVEDETGSGLEARLHELSVQLAAGLEASRSDIARKLEASTQGRFDRMERKLGEVADEMRQAEQQSAQAIERMGREVLNVADGLNRRMTASEARSADAIDQVGGEVARIAQAVESKLSRSEGVQAEALEKLGAEINRISERLAERISSAERRSAQAIDDVGEQVARVNERMNQRSERVSDELAERIRQSEERTARLLDEAREKIDARLADTQRRLAETPARPPAPSLEGSEAFEDLTPPEQPRQPQPPQVKASISRAVYTVGPPVDHSFSLQRRGEAAAAFRAEAERPAFDAEDFEAADGFAPLTSREEGPVRTDLPEAFDYGSGPEGLFEDDADVPLQAPRDGPELPSFRPLPPSDGSEAAPQQRLSTREVIEQARAAALSAAQSDSKGRKAKEPAAPAAEKAKGSSLFSAFSGRPKRRAGSSLQTALMVVGGAAFLSVGAAGVVLMGAKPGGQPPARVARALADLSSGQAGKEITAPEADTTPYPAGPRASMAVSPTTTAAPPAAVAAPDLSDRFAQAAEGVESGRVGAVDELRKVADLGHAPAQFYLAKLYETGQGGLKKDLVESRRWTSRAAEGGDRKAMHNLAIAFISGTGGPKNSTTAAQWFRRAAELGLVDSQYNLAALYEQGLGVGQNAAEAYKWYLVAARSGDRDAKSRADLLRTRLTPDARLVADRAAAAFRPAEAGTNPMQAAVPSLLAAGANLATAQLALSRLGYYQGPTDGSPSPALKFAIAAYQRDQGVAATGVLDNTTLSRLAVFTR